MLINKNQEGQRNGWPFNSSQRLLKLLNDANILGCMQRGCLTEMLEVKLHDGSWLRFSIAPFSLNVGMSRLNETMQPVGSVKTFDLTKDGEEKLRRLLEEIKKQLPNPTIKPTKGRQTR